MNFTGINNDFFPAKRRRDLQWKLILLIRNCLRFNSPLKKEEPQYSVEKAEEAETVAVFGSLKSHVF
jgi:hypothetical protein